jgi:two-component system nitrate/nitrite response regulator NarL
MKPKAKAGVEGESQASFSNGAPPSGQSDGDGQRAIEPNSDFTRILLVDDHPVVRKGLSASLSGRSNLVVVGEAADGLEALVKVGELRPDLVLMDVEMPRLGGLEATRSICREFPNTKVLILSVHDNIDFVVQAIQMGARGFALKTSSAEELVKAIEIVQQGEPFFPSQTAMGLQGQRSKKSRSNDPGALFEREKEVLIHLAAGYGNREIGEHLNISIRTVESHRARLMKKLNIHTIAGLTRYALAHGFITMNPTFSFPMNAEPSRQIPEIPHTLA